MYKYISLVFTLLIAVSILFTACGEDDPIVEPVTDAMTAKVTTPAIGTANFTATTISATTSGTLLNISGAVSGKSMTISITNNGTTGTRAFAVAGPAFATYIDGTQSFTASSGSITIATWNTTEKTITGTFQYDAQTGTGAGRSITEGTFAANYQ
jgi:hypothetical protein